jgi:hypothetical protein
MKVKFPIRYHFKMEENNHETRKYGRGKTARNWCWIGEVLKKILVSTCKAKGACTVSKNCDQAAARIGMWYTNSTTYLRKE